MRISQPIYKLKQRAKRQSKDNNQPLNAALNQVAHNEGFKSWGHLSSVWSQGDHAQRVLSTLGAGDLLLLGARPGHGKTLLALNVAVQAQKAGRNAQVFTLDYTEQDVRRRYEALGVTEDDIAGLHIDTSDNIHAGYIVDEVSREPALIVIDYLQLLDQKRTHPPLQTQIETLQVFVKHTNAICIVLTQIDRFFDLSGRDMPTLQDVRETNPLDLSLFDKACFLHQGRMNLATL